MDMGMGQNDFDRLLFFEHARKQAEITYAQNPQDADVSPRLFLFLSLGCSVSIDSGPNLIRLHFAHLPSRNVNLMLLIAK